MNNEYVATIGFFDGVHRGHVFLMEQVKAEAERRGLHSMAVTFDSHPREVLRGDCRPLTLTTAGEKARRIERTGIERCVVLPFSAELAALSAFDFMKTTLRDKLNVRCLVIGYDNRFGHNRKEGFDDYAAYGRQLGIDVVRAGALAADGGNVSSSMIRSLLQEGRVDRAACLLGYRYRLCGTVVGGVQEGRKMGFPTANISVADLRKLIPANGVYAVETLLGDGVWHPAMMNIGNRPTFDGKETTLEVNIFGYSGNLYGQEISVAFASRLRAEQRFGSEEELMAQLRKDREAAMEYLENNKGNDK